MTLAEKIIELREAKGMTRYKLAQITGIHQQNLYQLEKGKTTKPTYFIMYRLSKALEVSMDIWAEYMEDCEEDK